VPTRGGASFARDRHGTEFAEPARGAQHRRGQAPGHRFYSNLGGAISGPVTPIQHVVAGATDALRRLSASYDATKQRGFGGMRTIVGCADARRRIVPSRIERTPQQGLGTRCASRTQRILRRYEATRLRRDAGDRRMCRRGRRIVCPGLARCGTRNPSVRACNPYRRLVPSIVAGPRPRDPRPSSRSCARIRIGPSERVGVMGSRG
jgi:hypothetical protein